MMISNCSNFCVTFFGFFGYILSVTLDFSLRCLIDVLCTGKLLLPAENFELSLPLLFVYYTYICDVFTTTL